MKIFFKKVLKKIKKKNVYLFNNMVIDTRLVIKSNKKNVDTITLLLPFHILYPLSDNKTIDIKPCFIVVFAFLGLLSSR